MAETKIEWADRVWNPITGCSKISEGCQHCYAERMSKRLAGRCGYDKDNPFKVTFHKDKLDDPLRWRKPSRIFVCSMGDLFHKHIPEIEVLQIFSIMAECPQHTFMVLTKRPERMEEILTSPTVSDDVWLRTSTGINDEKSTWPLPNVWLGVTAENQARADERIPILLQTPAAKRFVSVEPMLGPVDLNRYLYPQRLCDGHAAWQCDDECPRRPGLDWVICGGETGPGARPVHPDWARLMRDQCVAAGTPFFFKSWGDWSNQHQSANTVDLSRLKSNQAVAKADGGHVLFTRVGKKNAGRLLDGQEWRQYPEVRV